MKLLAIDSSGMTATVAVLEDDKLSAEYTINYKKTHSQTLVPMLDEIRKMTDLDLSSLDAIAVAGGPGSFTGLRSATAKGLGLALDKPIVSVSTLEGLAMNAWGYDKLVCPIMDARRDQVYTGIYRFEAGSLKTVMEGTAESIAELMGQLDELNERVLFLGDGVPVFKDTIDAGLKAEHEYAPAHMSRQRAGALAALAAVYYAEGRTESPADHRPEYLRPSQAERVKAEREEQ